MARRAEALQVFTFHKTMRFKLLWQCCDFLHERGRTFWGACVVVFGWKGRAFAGCAQATPHAALSACREPVEGA